MWWGRAVEKAAAACCFPAVVPEEAESVPSSLKPDRLHLNPAESSSLAESEVAADWLWGVESEVVMGNELLWGEFRSY